MRYKVKPGSGGFNEGNIMMATSGKSQKTTKPKVMYQPVCRPPFRIGTQEELLQLQPEILSKDQAYWKTGSGGILLEYEDPNTVAHLAVSFRAQYGFIMAHNFRKHPAEPLGQYYSFNGKPFKKPVSICHSGEFFWSWDACYVKPEEAWNAICEFFQSGVRWPGIAWTKTSKLPPFPGGEENMYADPY
jgi:hypothetical protein